MHLHQKRQRLLAWGFLTVHLAVVFKSKQRQNAGGHQNTSTDVLNEIATVLT